MGASHRLDLTTDVTHLIVGQMDTPKYKHVAKERPDIHVLKPEWIEAMRDAWRSGEDFDVAALVEQYRLPALYGLQICVTGFDDLDHRLDMIQSINDHGATYNGDLTRAVTHLIANRPEGPKYDRAKQWGLKIVSLKWFQESLRRGMALEEALYDPLRPEAMQGQGAFVREYQRESLLSKRNREDAGSSFAEESGKRKMRRTMSARLNSHSQNLWAEMSGVDDAPAPVKTEDEWTEAGQALEGVSWARSRVSGLRDITPADSSRPVSRATSVGPEPKRGLFHNCLFLVLGHPEKRVCCVRLFVVRRALTGSSPRRSRKSCRTRVAKSQISQRTSTLRLPVKATLLPPSLYLANGHLLHENHCLTYQPILGLSPNGGSRDV